MGFLKSLFGSRTPPPAPQAVVNAVVAAPPTSPPRPPLVAPGYITCDRRYFEILETYQNRTRPLHDHVSWDVEEERRLKALRVEAYQLRNATGFQPHDVFHLWPYHAVDPEHVIKRVTLKAGAPASLPDYSHVLHVTVVSDHVMKTIAAFEEGRHAFYPLEVISADGRIRHQYHFMQFLEHTDCVIPKLGGFRKGVRQDGTTYWVRSSGDDRIFLDVDRIGSRHFFYDKRAKSGCFISAELASELDNFLPRGLYLSEVGVVKNQN